MKPEMIVYGLVLADVIIGIGCGISGDLWRAGYWLAAGFLSFSTTRL